MTQPTTPAELAAALVAALPAAAGGLTIAHNEHRQTREQLPDFLDDADPQFRNAAARQQAIATDELWTLQWYPTTAVSCRWIAAPTLAELLEFAASTEDHP